MLGGEHSRDQDGQMLGHYWAYVLLGEGNEYTNTCIIQFEVAISPMKKSKQSKEIKGDMQGAILGRIVRENIHEEETYAQSFKRN